MLDLTIRTKRLALRPLQIEDAPDVQRLASNWDVARMTSFIPHPYPDDGAVTFILQQERMRTAGTDYVLGVEYLGQVAGCLGLHMRGAHMEIGYWFGVPYWGYGLATEAARGAIEFAFTRLAAQKLEAFYYADNAASGRVLTKSGFQKTGRARRPSIARCGASEGIVMELSREAWAANRAATRV